MDSGFVCAVITLADVLLLISYTMGNVMEVQVQTSDINS